MKSKAKQIYLLGAFSICALISSCAKPSTTPTNTTKTTQTSLELTIYDGSGALMRVPSPLATIQLYKTVADQKNKTNPVTGVLTSNSQAALTINNLENIDYYFNAYSSDGKKSNATTFNQTNTLVSGVNKLEPVVK